MIWSTWSPLPLIFVFIFFPCSSIRYPHNIKIIYSIVSTTLPNDFRSSTLIRALAASFKENFKKFEAYANEEILEGQPPLG